MAVGHRFEELEALGQRRPACDECGSEALPGYRLPWWLDEGGEPLWGFWCGACVRRAGLRPVVEGTRQIEPQPEQMSLL